YDREMVSLQRALVACAVLVLVCRPAHAQPVACPGNALVTLDDGAIVNVEWPVRSGAELRGRAITNATLLTEYQFVLRSDASVDSVALTARALDGAPSSAQQAVAAGAVYWSDRLPSSLEQLVLRARSLGA